MLNLAAKFQMNLFDIFTVVYNQSSRRVLVTKCRKELSEQNLRVRSFESRMILVQNGLKQRTELARAKRVCPC